MTVRPSRAEPIVARRASSLTLLTRAAPTVVTFTSIAIVLWFSRTSALFTRPLWLDEIHTLLVADAPTTGATIRNLAAGADFNPPALYLLYRVVAQFAGPLSEVPMRMTAAVSVAIALSAVYLLLRGECGRVGAATGCLATLSHPTVLTAAFDARFYGPWLAGAALLMLVIKRVLEDRTGWLQGLQLATLSAFVCTIHYFGVVSWFVAACAGVLYARRRGAKAQYLVPMLVGPIALGLCIPIYLRQRAALTVSTWNPSASLADHAFLLLATLMPLALVPPLVAWGASAGLKRSRASGVPRPERFGPSTTLLLAQAAVPVILALFSLLVQPATQPRYWITGTLAAGALAAVATARSARLLRGVVVTAVAVATLAALRDEDARARDFAARVRQDASYAMRAFDDGHRLVARRRHTVYPLLRADARLSKVVVLFDEASTRADSQLVNVDREVARIHQRLYGFPRMVDAAVLDSEPEFYFVEYDSTRTPTAEEFPHHAVERLDKRLFRVRSK